MNANELRKYVRKQRGRGSRSMHLHQQLFLAWCEAAAEYQRIGSGAAMARCNAARIAWYDAVYGGVPATQQAPDVDWQSWGVSA